MSMFTLQKWAKTVGASVIEPFVQNSTFTLPVINSQQQLINHLRFRDYFDIDIWNDMSIIRNGTPLISWENFVNQSPKKFIFVILLKHVYGEQRQVYVDDEIMQQTICNDIFVTFKDNYRFYIHHLLKIQLVRKICLSFYRNAMHIDDFTNIVYENFSSSDTLVWFPQIHYRGCYNTYSRENFPQIISVPRILWCGFLKYIIEAAITLILQLSLCLVTV